MEQVVITSREAAQRLGVHQTTITRWCQSGKLPNQGLRNGSRKLGYRIPEQAIVAIQATGVANGTR